MNCSKCGNLLADDAKFCGVCGAQVNVVQPAATEPSNQQAQAHPVTNAYSQPQAEQVIGNPNQAYQPGQGQQASYVNQYPVDPAPSTTVVTTPKGVLGQAWSDITSSQSWIPRILLLIIMNCVPVLNLYSSGYLLQWGADASRDKNPGMPKGTFDKNCFLTGLFYSILSFLMVIAGLWMVILYAIPIIGAIAALVISLFASAFLMLAGIRMALFNKFGKAFDLSELFRKYKTALGSLFGAAIVPSIAFGVCVGILVALLVMGGSAFWSPYLSNPYSMMYSSYAVSNAVMGGIAGIVLVVLMALLCIFFYGFAQVWSMRAVGVWVSRNCPDWAVEAKQVRE